MKHQMNTSTKNMNKKSLIAISILWIAFAINSYSQTWCPPGATWYYSDYGIGTIGYSKLTYSTDTVIKKIPCQKITHYYKFRNIYSNTLTEGYWKPYFTYSENGATYLYNDNLRYGKMKFQLLFDMNAVIGDNWLVPLVDTMFVDSLYSIKVVNTGTKNINGFNLKWLYVTIGSYPNYEGGTDTITERFGFRYDNIEFNPLVETSSGKLRCYSDNDFGLYATKESSSCDFITAVSELQLKDNELKVYPNPANDKLTINLPFSRKQKATVDLYDLTGKLIRSNTLKESEDELEISTANLSEGIYIYKLNVNGAYIKSGKLSILH
jgi:hypothetical protein